MNLSLEAIAGHPPTVLGSAVIAVAAMYVALELADRVYRAADRVTARLWVAAGSLAMGSGIWATHFVGMSAAIYPFRAAYDTSVTLASWAVAVAASAVVLDTAARRSLRTERLVGRAILAGVAVTAMHYIGTEALVVRPSAVYHPGLVILALVVMVAGTLLALRMFNAMRDCNGAERTRRQLAAASVYGGALAAMHYTGMASTGFREHTICVSNDGLDVALLGGTVGFASIVFLGLVLLMTSLERRAEVRAKRLNGSLDRVRDELRFVTFNDAVTGLPNRLVFQDRLKQATARCDRTGESLAVLFIDLDGFKAVDHSWNDSHGNDTLQHVAASLVNAARASDTVANVGDDHFLVMMDGIDGVQPAVQVAERIAEILRNSCSLEPHAIRVTASIGITMYPADRSSSALVANASTAATAARHDGGDGYRFFEADMNAEARSRSQWLEDLRRGIEQNQFELYYQPKIHAHDGRIAGAEALLRWHHPEKGMVSPAVFIPLAEQFGLINALGSWVIRDACRQMRAWIDAGIRMRIAINLSVHQLRQSGLADEITRALAEHAVDPALLTCEITESDAMDDSIATLAVLERLDAVGIALSIDDFGTGYSSLSYLRRMPLRQLKIDQSFVGDLETSDDARAIVEAIINLAHALRLEVVAEGVETHRQKDILLQLRCDKLQGYLFAKPMPAADLTKRAADPARTTQFLTSIFDVTA